MMLGADSCLKRAPMSTGERVLPAWFADTPRRAAPGLTQFSITAGNGFDMWRLGATSCHVTLMVRWADWAAGAFVSFSFSQNTIKSTLHGLLVREQHVVRLSMYSTFEGRIYRCQCKVHSCNWNTAELAACCVDCYSHGSWVA